MILNPTTQANLSMADFKRLSRFIHSRIGIRMPDRKRGMVESRLRKRLNLLCLESYGRYCDYLFSPEGMESELSHFINVITTNKTDFFREAGHFRFLTETALPELCERAAPGRHLKLWSAACSKGDEPYTLAMVVGEFAETHRRHGISFSILATDISTRVLDVARKAIYEEEEIAPVAMPLRKKYLLRSRDRKKGQVRIVPELRRKVRFHHMNLMDLEYPIREAMDVIFCRNVVIYFDRATQDALMGRLCRHLAPGGYLFMGHSEVLNVKSLPLVSVAPTTYRKTA